MPYHCTDNVHFIEYRDGQRRTHKGKERARPGTDRASGLDLRQLIKRKQNAYDLVLKLNA